MGSNKMPLARLAVAVCACFILVWCGSPKATSALPTVSVSPSVSAGTYASKQTVAFSVLATKSDPELEMDPVTSIHVYYTTNGSDPDTSSSAIELGVTTGTETDGVIKFTSTDTVTISSSATLKFLAVAAFEHTDLKKTPMGTKKQQSDVEVMSDIGSAAYVISSSTSGSSSSGSGSGSSSAASGSGSSSSSSSSSSSAAVYVSYILRSGGADILNVATNATGSWASTQIDASAYQTHTSLAIDGNGKVHISYCNSAGSFLRYATNSGGSWATTSVIAATPVTSSIAVDSSNNPRIAYFDLVGDLTYRAYNAGWTSYTDITGVVNPAGISMAIDNNDYANISYIDHAGDTNAKFAKQTGASSFSVSTIEAASVYANDNYQTSISLDSSGNAHVAYRNAATSKLSYATNASGSWVVTALSGLDSTTIGRYNSIGIGPTSGKVYIANYQRVASSGYGNMQILNNIAGSLDPTDASTWASSSQSALLAGIDMIIDSSEKLHVCYFDSGTSSLYYGTNKSGTWTNTAIVTGMTNSSGAFCSIGVVGARGRNHR